MNLEVLEGAQPELVSLELTLGARVKGAPGGYGSCTAAKDARERGRGRKGTGFDVFDVSD
jgi:hypothetical protein